MDAVREYLISITAAAIIAGIVTSLTKKSGSISSIVKLLAGLFMTVTILSPVIDLPLNGIQFYLDDLSSDAESVSKTGKDTAEGEIKQIITERSRAYILEKAEALGAELEVEVFLQDLIPCSVEITGAVSPFARMQLSQYIAENLGVSSEDQRWIG